MAIKTGASRDATLEELAKVENYQTTAASLVYSDGEIITDISQKEKARPWEEVDEKGEKTGREGVSIGWDVKTNKHSSYQFVNWRAFLEQERVFEDVDGGEDHILTSTGLPEASSFTEVSKAIKKAVADEKKKIVFRKTVKRFKSRKDSTLKTRHCVGSFNIENKG